MELISFLTVVLPLLTGPQTLEMAVADSVARVEVRLDGERLAELTEPPWTVSYDLGDELLPHRLEAVALGSGGDELGRKVQWLNVAESVAAASLAVVEADDGSQVVEATWDHANDASPLKVLVTCDGEPLRLDGGVWRLPPFADDALHVVRAELTFAGGLMARAGIVAGRHLTGRNELTAVPVEITDGDLPDVSAMDGWFSVDGEPVQAVAVDNPSAEVVVVLDEEIDNPWFKMTARERKHGGAASSGGWSSTAGTTSDVRRSRATEERAVADLSETTTVRILSAVPTDEAAPDELFESSRAYAAPAGHVLMQLPDLRPKATGGQQTLADAVAMAGRMAASGNPRRAVLVLVSRDLEDASAHTPDAVMSYLRALRVPLEVWSPESRKVKDSDWGSVQRISTVRQFDAALRDLQNRLEAQRIVWVRGAYLPQEVELGSRANGVELAGASFD